MKTIKPTKRELEQVPTGDLIPYARNAKRHDDAQVAAIAGSITEFGFTNPVLIGADNGIIAGHGRVMAAHKLGLATVPCLRLSHLTDTQRRAYVIADNRLAEIGGGWDEEMLKTELVELQAADVDLAALGWEGDDLAGVMAEPETEADAEPQIDRAAELNKKWKVKPGDLWQIGEHRLLCGDSTKAEDVQRVMGGEKADCVFTSPPYAVGVDYGATYEDNIENLRAMLPKLSALWIDVVCDGGFAVVNFGDILSGKDIADSDVVCEYPMALEYWPPFRKDKWTLWARRVWCKPGAAVVSSRHCIGTNRAASNYEHVWTWKRPGTPPVNDQISGDWPSQAGWFDTTHENKLGVGLKDHGAGMPITVAGRSIHWHSRTSHIVHEPFCGTGTTMVACENLHRKCRGIEISCDYVAVCLERMQTAFPAIKIERA